MYPENRSIPNCAIIPELDYPEVCEAVTWLCAHFGFKERLRIAGHRAQLCFNGGAVIVMQRVQESAGTLVRSASSIMVRVDDIDARYRRASAGGLRVVRPIADYPYGERQFTVEDFAGHVWTFTQTIFDADPPSWGGELVPSSPPPANS